MEDNAASGEHFVTGESVPADSMPAVSGNHDEWVTIPCSAVLARLPHKLRGSAWQADNFPEVDLMLNREDVVRQLGQGCVRYPARLFLEGFPEGWINPDYPDMEISLDLAQVVAVLPPSVLQVTGVAHADMVHVEEVLSGKGFFKAKPAPLPEIVEVAEEAFVTAPVVDEAGVPLWDGIERSMVAVINGVDINSASAAELRGLPGIGTSRAKEIIAYRHQHGHFPNIYALAKMPGIGEKLFRRATGLPLNARRNRHQLLNEMLGFDKGASAPSLKMVLERLATLSGAAGCLLTGMDGIPMGCTAGVRHDAPRLAAVTTQLFRKTGRRLLSVLQADVECLALPLGNPPRLLFAGENFFLIVVEGNRRLPHREVRRIGNIFKEIRWMLSCRAVVSSIGLM